MHGMIKYVFLILGTLALSLLLYTFVFGAPSRNFYWSALEPSYQETWGAATYKNGTERSDIYDEMWTDILDSEEIKW